MLLVFLTAVMAACLCAGLLIGFVVGRYEPDPIDEILRSERRGGRGHA